ncbi:alpha-ketoglutarate-dependent dioxygenase AlkB [Kocuria sp.]|uniref:alpha-ketoglutarate-dependent dioxygenase AlkB family protein n=1 Tax=Kocuria sp. TaxID=1871328 RepID=UPI0026DB64F5|nr:alpha-ketoglutarate-dependent dioxygenase AlkB [Kocuria sp.]MDO4920130.1 alpha-ketoglutarate-dependent dioxygenase AlkB [Kocuria sp.]
MADYELPELFTVARERTVPAPGAVHVPDWLDPRRQRELVAQCRAWVRSAPMRHQVMPGGGRMSVQSVMLGAHGGAYRYGASGGSQLPRLPDWLVQLGRQAVADAYGTGGAEAPADPGFHGAHDAARDYLPDSALVNYYDGAAHMGMHQDRDEFSAAPIVSLSLGDTCVFRLGNTETRTAPYQDVELRSGDLFVFGGPSRYAFHGVPKVLPGTGGRRLGLRNGGRLNITLRMTGGRGPGAR